MDSRPSRSSKPASGLDFGQSLLANLRRAKDQVFAWANVIEWNSFKPPRPRHACCHASVIRFSPVQRVHLDVHFQQGQAKIAIPNANFALVVFCLLIPFPPGVLGLSTRPDATNSMVYNQGPRSCLIPKQAAKTKEEIMELCTVCRRRSGCFCGLIADCAGGGSHKWAEDCGRWRSETRSTEGTSIKNTTLQHAMLVLFPKPFHEEESFELNHSSLDSHTTTTTH
ncbi:hypothetical protein B0T10DRAFT_462438 [Thelonectria olida]|uniref:Uncharacterized protein n=1 Tax=Thelonectria olida TaxID=1576542 RepID=A0A9P9ALX8_9HYPO|nr:hypothetical protein B0T10DRAFT_462438 [Thelonectria olida]